MSVYYLRPHGNISMSNISTLKSEVGIHRVVQRPRIYNRNETAQ